MNQLGGLCSGLNSIHLYAFALQFLPCSFDLLHKLRVCLGHVVECVDTPAEFGQEVRAERNQGPERKLMGTPLAACRLPRGCSRDGGLHTTGTI